MLPIPKKVYDILTIIKIVLGVLIPAVIALNEVYSFSFGYQLIQTLTILEGMVIAFLKIDSTEYFKGKEETPRDE